ncbi:MAG: OmpH family outer membrane protein [Candidatus Berkiella sp.]
MKLTHIVLALGLAAGFAPALQADEAKIGVIDMRAVVSNSPQAKAAMEKLKKEFKAREEKIMAQEKSLKEKTEKLQRNSAVMSEAEKSKLEKEVMAGQREMQRLQAEFREDAAMRQQEEMKKVIDKVTAAIDDIAKKEKYDLVFVREAAPYASKQMDITDKVIKATATPAA